MEGLLFAHGETRPTNESPVLGRITTTRFANVLFSDGSLPWGMLQRLAKRQPLVAPGDVRRYFVTPEESGHLCLLAAACCPHQHILIPRFDRETHQRSFLDIARIVLAAHGLRPFETDDEEEARHWLAIHDNTNQWPLLVTRTDTSGEKAEEIFRGKDEEVVDLGLGDVEAVKGGVGDKSALAGFLDFLAGQCATGHPLNKAELVARLASVVPSLRHLETGRTLDQKI